MVKKQPQYLRTVFISTVVHAILPYLKPGLLRKARDTATPIVSEAGLSIAACLNSM